MRISRGVLGGAGRPTPLLRRTSGGPDPVSSAIDAAHAQVLHLEEFLDAVVRALAADAAFLHAAERGDLGRDDALVDADDAVFERLGDAPDAADVAAVEIGGEPPPLPPPPRGGGVGLGSRLPS